MVRKIIQRNHLTFDFENVLVFPYLRPVSILFSFSAILRSALLILTEESWIWELPMTIIGLYFHLASIIISLTYLNSFALVSVFFVFFTNIVTRLFEDEKSIIVISSVVGTLMPFGGFMDNAIKTVLYTINLVAVIIVINSPYDATGFEYGQNTIFGSFQANLLVATIILSGFVSMFLWPLARWFQFIVSSFTLLLIFASFCWIFFHDLNSKAFVTYTIASNHTVSIRGELINQVEEIHESCSLGNLETFSQLTSSSQSPLQQKVLKVESLQELDRLSNIPSLSVGLVLVKMTSPYLPASPKIKLEKKLSFNVLLIHQKDWHRLPQDGTSVYFSRHLNEIQPKFKCDYHGCIKGRKSPNGKAIYGSQYRTRECFWLGKPCKNHQTIDFQPICNDPDVKICDTEVITVYE
jgi:hypothetical protein